RGRGRGTARAAALVDADGHRQLRRLAFTHHGELHDLADGCARDDALQIAWLLDGRAIDGQDHVVGLHATAIRGLSGDHLAEEPAAHFLQVVLVLTPIAHLAVVGAEPPPPALPLRGEPGQKSLHVVRGYGDPDGAVAGDFRFKARALARHV